MLCQHGHTSVSALGLAVATKSPPATKPPLVPRLGRRRHRGGGGSLRCGRGEGRSLCCRKGRRPPLSESRPGRRGGGGGGPAKPGLRVKAAPPPSRTAARTAPWTTPPAAARMISPRPPHARPRGRPPSPAGAVPARASIRRPPFLGARPTRTPPRLTAAPGNMGHWTVPCFPETPPMGVGLGRPQSCQKGARAVIRSARRHLGLGRPSAALRRRARGPPSFS